MKTTLLNKLVRQAAAARRRAYAPYSQYRVGAAALTASGLVFQGCNVENASLGLTICAERVALAAAITAGYRRCQALAIVGDNQPTPYPCGACLQFMAEFCRADCPILLATAGRLTKVQVYSLKDLLPKAFRLTRK
ncbi:MAG: cytidine deaminase [Lentisphaerae bacterium]|nr:cytidine deaminase [Lentisphaerota bacterium]